MDSLVWALGHPDGDRALVAARTLGRLKAQDSVPALRATVEGGADVYVRAEALRSLIAIKGAGDLRSWLDELVVTHPSWCGKSLAKHWRTATPRRTGRKT